MRCKGWGLGDFSLQPQQLKPVHVCRYMPIWSHFFLLAYTWNNRVKTALSLTPACNCHSVFSPMYLLTYKAHWNSHFNLKWVKYTVAFKYMAGFCSSHVILILIPRCLPYPCIPCWLSDNWFGGDYWGHLSLAFSLPRKEWPVAKGRNGHKTVAKNWKEDWISGQFETYPRESIEKKIKCVHE